MGHKVSTYPYVIANVLGIIVNYAYIIILSNSKNTIC